MASTVTVSGLDQEPVPKPYLDISIGCLQRHIRLVAYSALACVLLSLCYLVLRPSAYTSHSRLLLDRRELHVATSEAVYVTSTVSVPWVQTQVELLRSETIAAQVVQRLSLATDPDFVGTSLGSRLRALFMMGPAETTADEKKKLANAAVRALQRDILVSRVGETYLIDIWVTGKNANKSALINNEIAHAYLDATAKVTSNMAEGASAWLRERVAAAGPSAEVVTEASPPLSRNPPGGAPLLVLSGLFGLLAGAAAALAKDYLDSTARTPEAVTSALGIECFGIMPIDARAAPGITPKASPPSGAQTGAEKLAIARQAAERAVTSLLFERNLRNVGISSEDPDAAGTAAQLLATAIAATGRKVLLAGLPDTAASKPAASVNAPLPLTASAGPPIVRLPLDAAGLTAATFSASPLADALGSGSAYDFVIVVLPALAPTASVRIAAHYVDAILLVLQWGRTDQHSIATLLEQQPAVRRKLAGSILSDVDLMVFPTYTDAARWMGPAKPALRDLVTRTFAHDLAYADVIRRHLAARLWKH